MYVLNHTIIFKLELDSKTMPKTLKVEYRGGKILCQVPLGIYLDGKTGGNIHDSIIPKYREIDPHRLVLLDGDSIRTVGEDAKRQLEGIATQDSPQVREALRNTIDLTRQLLAVA